MDWSHWKHHRNYFNIRVFAVSPCAISYHDPAHLPQHWTTPLSILIFLMSPAVHNIQVYILLHYLFPPLSVFIRWHAVIPIPKLLRPLSLYRWVLTLLFPLNQYTYFTQPLFKFNTLTLSSLCSSSIRLLYPAFVQVLHLLSCPSVLLLTSTRFSLTCFNCIWLHQAHESSSEVFWRVDSARPRMYLLSADYYDND